MLRPLLLRGTLKSDQIYWQNCIRLLEIVCDQVDDSCIETCQNILRDSIKDVIWWGVANQIAGYFRLGAY